MSIKLVSQEIKRFLSTPEPEVICIMGKWGVGKTFAWNQYLKEEASKGTISLKRYSYVSLFGQNSIEGLKYTIFENTEEVDQITAETISDVLNNDAISFIKKWGRKATGIIDAIPKAKEYASFVSRSFFLAVRKQIICIDDLERVGDGISIKNVLGLVSLLKEQRKCKIVLLLNDEKFDEKSAKEFKNQLEKIADIEMRFEPTPVEAADIGIDTSTSFHERLAKTSIGLGIVNIRVIRKIEHLLRRLEELLASHDKRVFEAAVSAVVLFGWIVYQPEDALSIDFIKEYNPFAHSLDKNKKETDQQKGWRVLLTAIDFIHFDEFDGVLLESVQRGYFDPDSIEKIATEYDKKWLQQDQDNSFSAAWDKYHGSFSNNADEVLDDMFSAFKKGVQTISPQNLDGTIGLFRKLGRDAQADEMITFYMQERQEKRDFYDQSRSFFLRLEDQKLKEAFQAKLLTFTDNRDPKEILMSIARSGGWNPDDTALLARLSTDDFYKLFKGCKGDDLRVVISQALRFSNYGQADTEMQTITTNAQAALRTISKESDINRSRVLAYGVTLEEDTPLSLEQEQVA